MRFLRIEHAGLAYYAECVDDATARLWSAAPWDGGQRTDRLVPIGSKRTLAPVTPSKVVCVGRNYRAHAAELGNDVPAEPLLFLKAPSALVGHEGTVVLPPASERVEFEGEIALVIGARLSNAATDEALAGIFGVTAAIDVTARDIQRRETQFTRAKSFDTFCPCGPCVETNFDPASLTLQTRVNGIVRQTGHARDFVFALGPLLSFVSQCMTLLPGDLVLTGTPAGVGPLAPDDTVEVDVGDLPTLRVRMVAASR